MGVNEYIHVGQNIKTARIARGISQREMASLMGLPVSTYANYEADRREMSAGLIALAALTLDVSLSALVGDQGCNVDPRKLVDDVTLKRASENREKFGYGEYTRICVSEEESEPTVEPAAPSGFTNEERLILAYFDELNDEGKALMLDYAELLYSSDKYKKRTCSDVEEKTAV